MSLAEDSVCCEGFSHFGKLLRFPGSLPCIHVIELSFIFFFLVDLSHVNLLLRPARRIPKGSFLPFFLTCITNKRFSEEQENEFIEYTDTTWKTDKEKTDPNDNFF